MFTYSLCFISALVWIGFSYLVLMPLGLERYILPGNLFLFPLLALVWWIETKERKDNDRRRQINS
jgi:hypothetical protein